MNEEITHVLSIRLLEVESQDRGPKRSPRLNAISELRESRKGMLQKEMKRELKQRKKEERVWD